MSYLYRCPSNCDPYPEVINWSNGKFSIRCPSCGISTKKWKNIRGAEKEWNRIAHLVVK